MRLIKNSSIQVSMRLHGSTMGRGQVPDCVIACAIELQTAQTA